MTAKKPQSAQQQMESLKTELEAYRAKDAKRKAYNDEYNTRRKQENAQFSTWISKTDAKLLADECERLGITKSDLMRLVASILPIMTKERLMAVQLAEEKQQKPVGDLVANMLDHMADKMKPSQSSI